MGAIVGIIAAVLLLVCLLFSGNRCFSQTPASPPSDKIASPPAATSTETIKSLDRAEIRALLKKLADTPAPEERFPGACCYSPAMPAIRANYVCPKCGERTVYDDSNLNAKEWLEKGLAKVVDRDIPSCREDLKAIHKATGDAISINESQFCRKCSPKVTAPKLVLHISYKGEKTRDIDGVSRDDLQLLREFLTGKLLTEGDNGSELPLKDHLPRLRKLLGVEPDE